MPQTPSPQQLFGAPVENDIQLFDVEPVSGKTHCVVDDNEIKVMSFRGTGVCSELCRKRRDNELTAEQYAKEKGDG